MGAFAADPALLDRCTAAATAGGSRLVLPSAGIGALDILAAGAVGGLDAVRMTVRKDPSAWYGTAAEDEFDLAAIDDADPKVALPRASVTRCGAWARIIIGHPPSEVHADQRRLVRGESAREST